MPVLLDDPDDEPEPRPLIDAAFGNQLERLKKLIASGIALDPTDMSTSALAHAAGQGHLEAARLLLDAGANVNHSPEGLNPLASACRGGHVAMAEFLLSRGARFDRFPQNVFGWALDRRAKSEVLALLVKHGLPPNLVVYGKTSVLMAACKLGDVELIKRLLALGADVNFRGEGTALTVAEENGHQVVVDLLLEAGAQSSRPPNVPDARRDALRAAANAQPRDASRRQAWGEWLIANEYGAAGARELQAAHALATATSVTPNSPHGRAADGADAARASSTAAAGQWVFVTFDELEARVSPLVADQFFPRAFLFDGARTLPLAILLGSPCTLCDELGETVCSSCNGTGMEESYMTGRSHPCPTRQTCFLCKGLKFTVYSKRFGKGACRHPEVDRELHLDKRTFSRCKTCGLPALDGDFACGVCGYFECRCSVVASSGSPPQSPTAQEKK